MYHKAYGIMETLAPLHVGASAGEETGNLNLIFRDQFTQTGIIPGSSIRGRFRSDMRDHDRQKANYWYGHEAISGQTDGGTTEALVKFEYASLVWLPVFCPGQPVVWVTCPRLLQRYQAISGTLTPEDLKKPEPYTASQDLPTRKIKGSETKVLFFNLGFLKIQHHKDLSDWVPPGVDLPADKLVIVGDNDIAMIHDMSLYRQSRTKLQDDMKKVENFFGLEALPEGCVLAFPIGIKENPSQPQKTESEEGDRTPETPESTEKRYFSQLQSMSFKLQDNKSKAPISKELYFGGLESIGFGRCNVTLVGG